MRKRLDVRLPEDIHAWLQATAKSSRRTVTAVVERALEKERALEAGPGGSSSAEQAEARATRSPVQPRTPTKQELDMARQELMNDDKLAKAKRRGR